MKEWMAQADSPEEAIRLKECRAATTALFNKITQYFKEWTTPISVLKTMNYHYKI